MTRTLFVLFLLVLTAAGLSAQQDPKYRAPRTETRQPDLPTATFQEARAAHQVATAILEHIEKPAESDSQDPVLLLVESIVKIEARLEQIERRLIKIEKRLP